MIAEKLRYTGLRGEPVEEEGTAWSETTRHPGGHPLQVRELRLGQGRPTSQLMAVAGDEAGYEMIDNEILSGLQLYRLAGSDHYPPELSRLVGYNADDVESFVLLEPYRGGPVGEIAGKLLTADRRRFEVSLLTGLRWLGLAGIAHRDIGPHTVRWDAQSRTAQITDFTSATIFGAPRQAVGSPPWAAPEQRAGRVDGEVGERDDIWAAARLIFYVITGEEPADRDSILNEPELAQLLEGVFGPPDGRPTCRELLVSRLGARDLVPPLATEDPVLAQGRAEFWEHHNRMHPSAPASSTSTPQTGNSPRRWKRIFMVSVGIVGALLLAVVIISFAVR
jgi:serine/threonine protein kinase